ncbi:hypothetical protein RIR_jg28476.t1 [Rhizophagus irregularis DAOM 181602=DAOM 197198]|nr:hypothetical protein RIR_jg28476.t1 [Rhizophagus irregularis DAOM 181602=DAOM 197198]
MSICIIPKNELNNNPLINYSTIQLHTPNMMKGILTDGLFWANIDENLPNAREGVYTFRIQGALYHRIGG